MVETMNFTTAIYDVSSPCNYRCIYCRNDWNASANYKHSDIEYVKNNLTKFKDNNFSRVIFTGGEFFIIPNWKEILEYSKKIGLETWIISNGYGISEKDIGFLKDHVSRINISFHAPNSKLYNEIMNPPSTKAFHKVLENMKLIGDNGIPLGVFYSPIKTNYHLLYDTVNLFKKKKIIVSDVNVNRIIQTQSTKQFFKDQKPLNLFEHNDLIRQVIKINDELKITSFLEAYPLCFISNLVEDKKKASSINYPCFLGRKAIAFNVDGSLKLCPATNFSMADSLLDIKNQIEKFNTLQWRNEKCNKCPFWEDCLGGCHAARGNLFADDPLLLKDDVELVEKIDPVFFDILINLYSPFLSSSYKKEEIQYTIFSKNKCNYPIGIIALKKTKTGGSFIEIALIPEAKGGFYNFLAINKFINLHQLKKIGWTVHKANLPSIKFLKKMNGGFFKNTVTNKSRIEAEGFFRVNAIVSKTMKENLDLLITESENKYEDWLKEYQKRDDELQNLSKYLKGYENENY
jgi:radical SAM protein with 4Fe4S-binding SPASM domain